MHYLDTSALAKLILVEAESDVLVEHVRGVERVITSELAKAELVRAVSRVEPERLPLVTELFTRVDVIPVSSNILTASGHLQPAGLRTLDAIHLASALLLRDELDAFVSYDERQIETAIALGFPVVSPGRNG